MNWMSFNSNPKGKCANIRFIKLKLRNEWSNGKNIKLSWNDLWTYMNLIFETKVTHKNLQTDNMINSFFNHWVYSQWVFMLLFGVYISCFCFLNFSKIDTTWTRSGASVSLWVYVIILLISFLFASFMDDLRCVNFYFYFLVF